MPIHQLMKEHCIALCVEYDAVSKSYQLYKNPQEELSSAHLFDTLILYGDAAYLETIKDEPLLPRQWSQGNSQCCIFPVASEKTLCLFFESDADAIAIYQKCGELMRIFQEAYHEKQG